MTLRELINQLTDKDSKSDILDYTIEVSVKEEGHYNIYDKLVLSLFNSSAETKIIELEIDYKR